MNPQSIEWQPLIDDCILHLEAEYQTLVALNMTLQGIGLALRNHNLADLQRLVMDKEQQMQRVQQVRQRRQTLRERIMLAMPTEGDVSIASWAESLDEVSRRAVLDWRNRLLTIARQTRQQAQINQVVVVRGVRLLNQAIDCFAGVNERSERYSAEGELVDNPTNLVYSTPLESLQVPAPTVTAATAYSNQLRQGS